LDQVKKELWRLITDSNAPIDSPEPLVCALNYRKGLHIIGRVLDILDTAQNLGYFSILFKRLECSDVCNIILGKKTNQVEEFMNNILPALTAVFGESSFRTVCSLIQIILERHNLIWLAGSRVGLVIMTMILSRAEILKQGSNGLKEENNAWEEIYNFIFLSFQNQFPELFKHNVEPEDEVFIWQFLSAMAVGASGLDHQRILVTELR
jgi:hypothetical protein